MLHKQRVPCDGSASCWNKIPKKAGRNSVMSHYSNCCWTPVPPGRSLFQFLPGLRGCSFTSLPPSALMLRQTPNNSSLTCYQTASLIPFPSLKGLCQMDKRPVWCGELSTSPFPTLSLTKLLRSPAPDVMLHSPNPKPASQPLLRRVPATFICKAESPAVGGEKL